MVKEKECSGCKKTKKIKEFSKNKASKDGLLSMCKKCDYTHRKESVEKQREINRILIEKAKKELNGS